MQFFFGKNEQGHEVAEEIVLVNETLDIPGINSAQHEMVCAIAMALKMYTDSIKEEEMLQSAIQHSMKMHSAWACKTHLFRQQPIYLPHLKRK